MSDLATPTVNPPLRRPEPTPKAETSTPAPTLDDLARVIKAEHQAVARANREVLTRAMRAGDLLIRAKEKMAHGEWLPWLKDHCEVSERAAQLYMQLAKGRARLEEKSAIIADLTLNEAARLLTVEPEDKPKPADEAGASDAGNTGVGTGSSGTGSTTTEAPKKTSKIADYKAKVDAQTKEASKEAIKDAKDVADFLAKWKALNEHQRLMFVEDEEETIEGLLARIKKAA
jgi:Protein of unknown function (DUF3102)